MSVQQTLIDIGRLKRCDKCQQMFEPDMRPNICNGCTESGIKEFGDPRYTFERMDTLGEIDFTGLSDPRQDARDAWEQTVADLEADMEWLEKRPERKQVNCEN